MLNIKNYVSAAVRATSTVTDKGLRKLDKTVSAVANHKFTFEEVYTIAVWSLAAGAALQRRKDRKDAKKKAQLEG